MASYAGVDRADRITVTLLRYGCHCFGMWFTCMTHVIATESTGAFIWRVVGESFCQRNNLSTKYLVSELVESELHRLSATYPVTSAKNFLSANDLSAKGLVGELVFS